MKKLFIGIAVIACFVFVSVATLLLVVNPNQFKPLIVKKVKESVGLNLFIHGDISWQVFPRFGLALENVELKNPIGFSRDNFVSVKDISIDVALFPLIDHNLLIGKITLNGADIQLENLKSGASNYAFYSLEHHSQSIPHASTKTSLLEPSVHVSKDSKPWKVEIEGIAIDHATLTMIDAKKNTRTSIQELTLNVNGFKLDQWTPFSFSIAGKFSKQRIQTDGTGEFKIDRALKQYALRTVKLNASYQNPNLNVKKVTLTANHFEVDKPSSVKMSMILEGDALAGDINGQSTVAVNSTFSMVQFSNFALKGHLTGSHLPMKSLQMDLNSIINVDVRNQKVNVTIPQFVANDMTLDGQLSAEMMSIPQIKFDLHSNKLDLDSLILTQEKERSKSQTDKMNFSNNDDSTLTEKIKTSKQLDLSLLNTLNVDGHLRIDDFKVSNLKLTNAVAHLDINKGKAMVKIVHADMYDGTIMANAMLNGVSRVPAYRLNADVKDVQIKPLLAALTGKENLEGIGNVTASLSGRMLSSDALKKNLSGTIAIKLADGSVHGINIPRMIRVNYAKFKGKTLSDEDSVKKTDFSSLTSTIHLKEGIASTQNIEMASPLLRIHGEGRANYLEKTMNFLVKTSLVKSMEGQGGKDIDELRDVTIPIKMTGHWDHPKYRLVFDDVMKQKARKELDRGLKKLDGKISDPKTKKALNHLLKGLFN